MPRNLRAGAGGRLRTLAALAGAAAIAATTAGCMGSSGAGSTSAGATSALPTVDTATTAQHAPVTITIWTGWSGRELKEFQSRVAHFTDLYPWITVKATGNGTTDKLTAAITAGNPPDVGLLSGVTPLGSLCRTGGVTPVDDLVKRDGLDLAKTVTPAGLSLATYKGTTCGLPVLMDVNELYWNRTLLAAAGYTAPPKTISELTAMTRKLTTRNADGSLKLAGFIPWIGYYSTYPSTLSPSFAAQMSTPDERSAISQGTGWTELLTWQRGLVDWLGSAHVQKFVADSADPFSAQNAFEIGKLALMPDGEWRGTFIEKDGAKVDYGVAPMPVADDHPEMYGASTVDGSVAVIPRGAKHPAEAWLLARFLSSDPVIQVDLAKALTNVPTSYAGIAGVKGGATPAMATALQIAANPKSSFGIMLGHSGGTDFLGAFIDRWQHDKVPVGDLAASLKKIDQQADAEAARLG